METKNILIVYRELFLANYKGVIVHIHLVLENESVSKMNISSTLKRHDGLNSVLQRKSILYFTFWFSGEISFVDFDEAYLWL